MAQIEVGSAKAGKKSIIAHLTFTDEEYTGKTVSVEVKLQKHTYNSGKTGYKMYSGRVAVDPETNLNFRLFNGMLGVYDPKKDYSADAKPSKDEEEDTSTS